MDKGSQYYERYLKGDNEGMECLIRDYSDGLILFLNTFVHDLATAEDLMMDTFVKLGVKRPQKKEGTGFKTWLYAIGKNVALDYLRKNRRVLVSLEEAETVASEEEALEQRMIRSQREEMIHRNLKRIPEEHARVLWLYYFEDMTAKEIAGVVHKSVHAAESLLSRARKSLKESLEKEGFSYEDL